MTEDIRLLNNEQLAILFRYLPDEEYVKYKTYILGRLSGSKTPEYVLETIKFDLRWDKLESDSLHEEQEEED